MLSRTGSISQPDGGQTNKKENTNKKWLWISFRMVWGAGDEINEMQLRAGNLGNRGIRWVLFTLPNTNCPPPRIDCPRRVRPRDAECWGSKKIKLYNEKWPKICQVLFTTQSRLMSWYESCRWVKVKVIKWCQKKWNEHNLMYICHKQCEIMHKFQRNSSNGPFHCFHYVR